MNNVIKKISAIALAFTLLRTGTAVTKTIAPQFDKSITASAAYAHNCCSYKCTISTSEWKPVKGSGLEAGFGTGSEDESRTVKYRCAVCGNEWEETQTRGVWHGLTGDKYKYN